MTEIHTTITRDELNRRFDYHPPSPEAADTHASVRWVIKDVAIYLLGLMPESREASLAITKLEEALFWANAAIARNQPKPEDAITVETTDTSTKPHRIPDSLFKRIADV